MQRRLSRPAVAVSGYAAAACGGTPNVGYRIYTFSSGMHAAVWYPTLSGEASFQYPNGFTTAMAEHAPVATCKAYPLIVFSHSFGGCGTQSVFFTEELARHGYIVVAPDHKDAQCKVDQPRGRFRRERPEEPFQRPGEWNDQVYADRRRDIEEAIREMLADREFGARIDAGRIGISGHSLGGYTALGVAGGWNNWRDACIKAALLFSPYASPFIQQQTLGGIRVPVMYQGGTRDFGITPSLRRSGDAYDSSSPPKYLVEFSGVGHGDFSMLVCRSFGSVEHCVQHSDTARLINGYAIGFLDRYLRGKSVARSNRNCRASWICAPLFAESCHKKRHNYCERIPSLG